MFTDVQGSTRQWEKDPITMSTALRMHNDMLRKQLSRFAGYEVKTEGDSFMIAFSSALDAVRFCLETQKSLLLAEWPEKLLYNSGKNTTFILV